MARKIPEINAGSMADIAFLLLIFFLVTTTMDIDQGIIRKLPPPVPPDTKDRIEIIKKNVFVVLVNSADQLLVNGQPASIKTLRVEAKEFLRPREVEDPVGSPQNKLVDIPGLGPVWKSKGVISLQNDRGTSYDMYIQVQNELTAAINELRDEFCKVRFGKKFSEIKDDNISKAVSDAIPVAISEAEPKELGGKQ